MASLVIFHHSPGGSPLHRLDPRLKLFIMLAAASLVFFLPGRGLLVLSAALIPAMIAGRAPAGRILRNGLVVWILIAAVFLSRAAGAPGAKEFLGLFSRAGLSDGAREAGRLVFLVFLGHLFVSVTSVSDIQRAVRRLVGAKTALLLGLTMRLVPELLDTAEEIAGALACRGLSLRRHPYRGTLLFGTLIARRTAEKSMRLAEALEARNYRWNRSWKPLRFSAGDAAALFIFAAAACGAAFV